MANPRSYTIIGEGDRNRVGTRRSSSYHVAELYDNHR